MGAEWLQLEFSLPAEKEDDATEALLAGGLPGWEVVPEESGRIRLRMWVLPEDAVEVGRILDEVPGCEPFAASPSTDDAWIREWAPIEVGRFVVRSLGGPAAHPKPGQLVITLAPALAFGGGEHPTTQLCLEALPRLIEPGDHVLDVGSGSGILSVAAALLGARKVEAADIDPAARRATQRAAEASGARSVRFLTGGVSTAYGRYDLVMANIVAPVLIELAPTLSLRIRTRGKLLLSGIRVEVIDRVAAAYPDLQELERHHRDGWISLLLGSSELM